MIVSSIFMPDFFIKEIMSELCELSEINKK